MPEKASSKPQKQPKNQPPPTSNGKDEQAPEATFTSTLPAISLVHDEPRSVSPAELMTLQRTIGNRAVGRLISKRRAGPAKAHTGEAPNSTMQRHHEDEQALGIQRSRDRIQGDRTRLEERANGRTPQVQRDDIQHSLAKITNFGVNVSNARGNKNQLGHAMDVWVEIDAGKNPVTPANARPNTVYGLELEYWEYVNVPNDNQGATGEKPWNDIHGMKPDASTFGTAAPGCDLTWQDAVMQAAAGTLTGKHRIGFRDIPGLLERPGRNVERTLKFRIIFNDGNRREEIFATQLLRQNNGQMGYGAYRDSAGNSLESHGFGGGGYVAGSLAEQQAITGEGNRLQPAGLPTAGTVEGALPLEARTNVQIFVAAILQGTAVEYIDLERAEFVKKVAADRQKTAAGDFPGLISETLMGDVAGSIAAGHYLIPTIAGTQRRQYPLPSGGLLVALVTGNSVLRMYYTDNTTRAISMNSVPGLAGRNWNINLRSFAEIPTETVRNSVNVFKSVSAPTTLKDIPLNAKNAHLRDFVSQGANYIVKVNKMIGAKIKQGQNVAVYEPEIRDASGEWLKARFGNKVGFIRMDKLTGVKTKVNYERDVKGHLTATSGNQAMETYFKKYFQDHGNGHAVYTQLATDYAGYEPDIASLYRELYGDAQFHKMKLDQETAQFGGNIVDFTVSAIIYDGNHPGMIQDVMDYLRAHPGEGDKLESVYNQQVPLLGYDVPATLGEIVHAHFLKTFRDQGSGFAVYNQLMTDYPDFAYRLKPAYRLVHGEDQLQTMLQAREQAEFAVDVPDPTSGQNFSDYFDFLTHGPFTLTDFVPTAGAGNAKFDASYDPMDNHMEIIVRVAYQFADNPYDPIDVSGEDPAFDRGFGRNTWNDQDKDNWKRSYATAATAVFNNSAPTIRCVRPGWNNIVAKPRFVIREVPMGNQHFVIDATKAVLTQEGGQNKLRGGGRSGAGSSLIGGQHLPSVMLQEYDVYDKLKDPRLHTYLHAGEKSQNIGPAYELDRRRLDEALGRLGKVDMARGGVQGTSDIRNLGDALKRLEIPSNLASLHPIVVKGVTNGPRNDDWAMRMATRVKNLLTAAGVGNPIEIATEVGTFNGALVVSKPPDPGIKDTYVTNWHRFTSAHEFGHMIGLIDEYYGASSGETVKEMISAGWLPPETRGDHLKLNPPKKAEEKAKQEGTIALLRRTGLESPDFAMNAPGTGAMDSKDMPKTTSIMTGGFDVTKTHMISAWEALVTMTAGHLNEKYWKIS